MIMTEAKGSTIQTTFGIVGLTRSELDEVQCFIDGLRKFTSDNEPMSGRGLAAQSRAQSQPDAMKWNAAVANSMALQPDQAAGRRGESPTDGIVQHEKERAHKIVETQGETRASWWLLEISSYYRRICSRRIRPRRSMPNRTPRIGCEVPPM